MDQISKVILVYFCHQLDCKQGRLSCLLKTGEMIDLVYCTDKRCQQECKTQSYLSCVCYSHCSEGKNVKLSSMSNRLLSDVL